MNLDETATLIAGIIAIIVYISAIVASVNIAKIKEENIILRKQEGKIIELLETLISNQEKIKNEVKIFHEDILKHNNGGAEPGFKNPEIETNKELLKLQQEQTEILRKILNNSNGEEKKKLLEKWKQATEIINNLDEN